MSDFGTKKYLLYADDDDDDRFLLVNIFETIAPNVAIKTVIDGYSTLDFLQNMTPPLPSLLILDMNMPGLSGIDVIERIRDKEKYKNLPIVIFTTSSRQEDLLKCIDHGVDFLTKPHDITEFERTAVRMLKYCHQ